MKDSESAYWYKNEMAGQIEDNYLDWNNRKTELGFWLGESFQGRGLVTKSCRMLIDYAFNGLNLNKVEMHCGVENRKSRKIAENLGFIEEGVIRQDGFTTILLTLWFMECWQANGRIKKFAYLRDKR